MLKRIVEHQALPFPKPCLFWVVEPYLIPVQVPIPSAFCRPLESAFSQGHKVPFPKGTKCPFPKALVALFQRQPMPFSKGIQLACLEAFSQNLNQAENSCRAGSWFHILCGKQCSVYVASNPQSNISTNTKTRWLI